MSSWPLLEVAFHVCPPQADASETWVPPLGCRLLFMCSNLKVRCCLVSGVGGGLSVSLCHHLSCDVVESRPLLSSSIPSAGPSLSVE